MNKRDELRFNPKPKPKVLKHHILVDLSIEDYAKIKTAAKSQSISIKDFARQGVLFALEHLDSTADAET